MGDRCEHNWPGSGCRECFPPNKVEDGQPVPIIYSDGGALIQEQMNPRRYRLVSDDSGHWYLIETRRKAEWEAFDFSTGNPPYWATRVDGVELLTFTDPQEDN